MISPSTSTATAPRATRAGLHGRAGQCGARRFALGYKRKVVALAVDWQAVRLVRCCVAKTHRRLRVNSAADLPTCNPGSVIWKSGSTFERGAIHRHDGTPLESCIRVALPWVSRLIMARAPIFRSYVRQTLGRLAVLPRHSGAPSRSREIHVASPMDIYVRCTGRRRPPVLTPARTARRPI